MSTYKKKVVPTITATSTVPELIKFAWLSFQEHERTKVERILMNRENELKSELEKLRKDNLRLKEEYDLMEMNQGLAELKKSKYESELMASKRECYELKEKLTKYAELLLEAKKNNSIIYSKKLKIEEKLGRFIGELYDEKNIAEEKEKEQSIIISECNEKIKVLEDEKLKMEEKFGKLIEELNNEKKITEAKNKMLLVLEKEKSRISSEFYEKNQVLEREKLEMEEKLARLIEVSNNEKKIAEDKSVIYSEFREKIQDLESEKHEMEEHECSKTGSKRKRIENKGEEDFQKKKWMCIADMNSDLKQDPQLCLNAICALHRYMSTYMKDTLDLSKSKAEYLINGDPEKRLSRSVSEVGETHPWMFEACERVAIKYYNKQLFEIYEKNLDPFFP